MTLNRYKVILSENKRYTLRFNKSRKIATKIDIKKPCRRRVRLYRADKPIQYFIVVGYLKQIIYLPPENPHSEMPFLFITHM